MAGAIQYESGTAMATEASYPYKAADGSCKTSFTTAIPQGGVTGYKSVGSIFSAASKSAMQSAVQQQPVSIAIEADQSAFQSYTGGILSSGCGTSLDHGVLAVGYNTAEDYWLVKNSWCLSSARNTPKHVQYFTTTKNKQCVLPEARRNIKTKGEPLGAMPATSRSPPRPTCAVS